MIVIRICLCVTVSALKHAVVVWIDMAGRAHTIRSSMVHGEVGVIEGGVQPSRRRMACRAAGRESRRDVVGVRRPLVVGSVTAVTIRRQRRVVVIHVAVGTGDGGVSTSQWE